METKCHESSIKTQRTSTHKQHNLLKLPLLHNMTICMVFKLTILHNIIQVDHFVLFSKWIILCDIQFDHFAWFSSWPFCMIFRLTILHDFQIDHFAWLTFCTHIYLWVGSKWDPVLLMAVLACLEAEKSLNLMLCTRCGLDCHGGIECDVKGSMVRFSICVLPILIESLCIKKWFSAMFGFFGYFS